MDIKKLRNILLFLILFSLFLPPLICLLLCGSFAISSFLNLPNVLKIGYPFTLSLDEYCSIIFSFISCISSILLSYVVYKLSTQTYNYDYNRNQREILTYINYITIELNHNIKKIESIINKTSTDYDSISTVGLEKISLIAPKTSADTIESLFDLYLFFHSCKQDENITQNHEKLYFNKNNNNFYFKREVIVELEKIKEELENECK